MVFAHPKKVDTHLIGQHRFVDDIAHNLSVAVEVAIWPLGHIAECVQSQLNHHRRITHTLLERLAGRGYSSSETRSLSLDSLRPRLQHNQVSIWQRIAIDLGSSVVRPPRLQFR